MDKARCIKALASVLAVFSLSISFSDTAAFAVDRSQLDWIEQQLETLSLRREESQAKVDELKNTKKVNCTPFVRQYYILSNRWGDFLCQRKFLKNDIHQNLRNW